jgi:hypothetical protein
MLDAAYCFVLLVSWPIRAPLRIARILRHSRETRRAIATWIPQGGISSQ